MSLTKPERVEPESEMATELIMGLHDFADQMRRRAFEVFESRGGEHGSDLADWLQAENEIQVAGPIDLSREAKVQRLRFALPGPEKKDLKVYILDKDLIVTGGTEEVDGEFSKTIRRILYRLSLSEAERTDEIVVNRKGNTLEITVPISEKISVDQTDKSINADRVKEQGRHVPSI